MQSIHLPMEDPPMIEIISPEKNNDDLIKKIKENITTNNTIASAEENEEDDIDSIDVPIPKISYYEGDSEL